MFGANSHRSLIPIINMHWNQFWFTVKSNLIQVQVSQFKLGSVQICVIQFQFTFKFKSNQVEVNSESIQIKRMISSAISRRLSVNTYHNNEESLTWFHGGAWPQLYFDVDNVWEVEWVRQLFICCGHYTRFSDTPTASPSGLIQEIAGVLLTTNGWPLAPPISVEHR